MLRAVIRARTPAPALHSATKIPSVTPQPSALGLLAATDRSWSSSNRHASAGTICPTAANCCCTCAGSATNPQIDTNAVIAGKMASKP